MNSNLKRHSDMNSAQQCSRETHEMNFTLRKHPLAFVYCFLFWTFLLNELNIYFSQIELKQLKQLEYTS